MGPAHDVAVAVDQRPAPAAVLGAPELAGSGGLTFPGNPVAGFDCREDALGIDRAMATATFPTGLAGRPFPIWASPGGAAVARHEESAAGPPLLSPPCMDLELPHSGEDRPGIRRIHGEVGATGLLIHEERPGPGDSAIERPGRRAPADPVGMPQRADEHDIGIGGMDKGAGDASGLVETHQLPAGSCVGGLVHPLPDRNVAADFSSPVPAQTMFGSLAAIAREPIDCTGWSSKICRPVHSTVAGFVNATGGGAGVVDPGVPGNADHGAEAIAFRADIPPAERVEYRGAEPDCAGCCAVATGTAARARTMSATAARRTTRMEGSGLSVGGRPNLAREPSGGEVSWAWCRSIFGGEILKSITARTEAFR